MNGSDSSSASVAALLKLRNSSNLTSDISVLIRRRQNEAAGGNAFLILAYSVLFIISFCGNALVCYVIFRQKRLYTVTNFFIANLAVADLFVTLVNVPFNIARNLMEEWPFGDFLCHLVNFSLMVSVYVSTFTLAAIALDRQQVLLYPLNPRISKPIGMLVLFLIWTSAIWLSLPYGIYTRVVDVNLIVKTVRRCRSDFPEPSDRFEQCLSVATIILQYCIPLTIIAITYGRIVRKLWARTYLGDATQNQQLSHAKAKRKSIKMLITVVFLFALCWMPLNLYHLLTDLHPNTEIFHYNSTVFFICHWIAISSTCYNPFVYCWLNQRFRAEVKSKFRTCVQRALRVHPGIENDGIVLRDQCGQIQRGRSLLSNSRSTSSSTKRKTREQEEIEYRLRVRGKSRHSSILLNVSKQLLPVAEENMDLTANDDEAQNTTSETCNYCVTKL